MIMRLQRWLLRKGILRKNQWFFKSEPSSFHVLSELGFPCPTCETPATHQSDYPSRARLFARCNVLFCTHCGCGFVIEMREALEQYYTNEYAKSNRLDREIEPAAYFESLCRGNNVSIAKYDARVQRQIDLLCRFGGKFGSVLDYGSGPGYFLYRCGAKILHAVEPDMASHKYLKYLKAVIHADAQSLPKATFDTIVASHALEHLPAETLHSVVTSLFDALAPGGTLLIEVPQGGHSHLHLAGERQEPHTIFFTGQSLVEVVRRAGGKILFQQALGRVESPRREAPIYTPSGPPFFRTAKGSLTVVCTTS